MSEEEGALLSAPELRNALTYTHPIVRPVRPTARENSPIITYHLRTQCYRTEQNDRPKKTNNVAKTLLSLERERERERE